METMNYGSFQFRMIFLQITQKPTCRYGVDSKLSLFRSGVLNQTHNKIIAKQLMKDFEKSHVIVNDILDG